jgi:hypothetical protein
MAELNFKSQLAIERAKQRLRNSSKVQALQNFYNHFNDQKQAEQEDNERVVRTGAQMEMAHKADLAIARQNALHRTASTFSEGARTFINVAEGPKWKAPFAALSLAHTYRKKVKDHDNSPFWVALVFAIILDLLDYLDITGGFIVAILKWFWFIPFMFGRGSWKAKLVSRIIVGADSIPFINWLPLCTVAVIYAWRKSAKEARVAKENLKEIEKAHKEYKKIPPNQEVYVEEVEMKEAYA